MPEKERVLSLRVTAEEYGLVEQLAARYDLEISRFLRAILCECFLDRKFLDRYFAPASSSPGPDPAANESLLARLEKREDEQIKLVDHLARRQEYFIHLSQAIFDLVGNMGFRLCAKGYEDQFRQFVDDTMDRHHLK